MASLENINIDKDILENNDKGILQNIDIDKDLAYRTPLLLTFPLLILVHKDCVPFIEQGVFNVYYEFPPGPFQNSIFFLQFKSVIG